MGGEEMAAAKDLVLSGEGPANERIMATYLLTLAGPSAWPSLKEIASAPAKEKGGPHNSEGEVKAVQEKAQKLMAIDALAEQASTDAAAKDELGQWARELPDRYLRDYADKKWKSLGAGR